MPKMQGAYKMIEYCPYHETEPKDECKYCYYEEQDEKNAEEIMLEQAMEEKWD